MTTRKQIAKEIVDSMVVGETMKFEDAVNRAEVVVPTKAKSKMDDWRAIFSIFAVTRKVEGVWYVERIAIYPKVEQTPKIETPEVVVPEVKVD